MALSAAEEVSLNSLRLARHYFLDKNYSRSFSHYLVHCHLKNQQSSTTALEPASSESIASVSYEEVESALNELIAQLEKKGCKKEIKEAFSQLLSLFPENGDLHFRCGLFLTSKDNEDLMAAKFHLHKASQLNKSNILAKHHYEQTLINLCERWHFIMLNDARRNEAFRKGIYKAVEVMSKKVDEIRILDVGTGSGIFALFAEEACKNVGKKFKIFASEMAPAMIETSTKVFASNESKATLVPKKSTICSLNEFGGQPIDILITETFDAGLLGERVLETLDHAWAYLLHENSIIVPCKAKVWAAPIACEYLRNISSVHQKMLGYLRLDDLRVHASWTKDEPYYCENLAQVRNSFNFLAEPQQVAEVDFQDREFIRESLETPHKINLKFQMINPGVVSGLALWFQLYLDEKEEIVIDTKPGADHCWEQAIFPVIPDDPANVEVGDLVEVNLKLGDHFEVLDWSIIPNKSDIIVSCDDENTLYLPVDVVASLNDSALMETYQKLTYSMSMDNLSKSLNILDATATCLISLQLMSISPRSNLSVFMKPNDESTKNRIDFISEIATANHIALNRISCCSDKNDDLFDCVFFEPVNSNGKLNSAIWTNFLPSLNLDSNTQLTLLPWRTSLYFVLIESEDLVQMARQTGDSTCADFKITQFINQLSVSHLEDISLSTLNHRTLTDPTFIHSFDFRTPSTIRETFSTFSKLIDKGTAHALVYWFVHEYGWDVKVSTLRSNHKQAAIMIEPTPVDPAMVESVSVLLHHQEGVLHFEVHS